MSRRKSYVWKISDEDFRQSVKESHNWTQLLHKFGKTNYGNVKTIKKRVEEDGIDTSHFVGSAANKKGIRKFTNDEILIINSPYRNNGSLKRRLLRDGLMKYECVNCGNTGVWKGKPLTLELDHINGDDQDNRLTNLRILCPNCHSQTDTFRGRKVGTVSKLTLKTHEIRDEISKSVNRENRCPECNKQIKITSKRCHQCHLRQLRKKQNRCIVCNVAISHSAKKCIKCYQISNRKIKDRPSKEQLLKIVREKSYCEAGRIYGVSDNTIRKWIK